MGDDEVRRAIPPEGFQFTPLRDGRPSQPKLRRCARTISIHAPPRGATHIMIPLMRFHQFQFTPLREGRPLEDVLRTGHLVFQFTPLREGRRHPRPRADRPGGYFNSRPSARGDRSPALDSVAWSLFQFTPLREGRRARPPAHPHTRTPAHTISIHAPPRGATPKQPPLG